MIDSKSSTNGKSNSSEEESQHVVYVLEERELAKHRLCHLKDSYDEYLTTYNQYLIQHKLIIALCGVVILFGIVIAFLKIVGKEDLLYSFKAIQSYFVSLVSVGSIVAFGGKFLFSDKKPPTGNTKCDPKNDAIRLCIKGELGEKIDDTTKKLVRRKINLGRAKSMQTIWATLSSIVVLFLVGVDYYGFLPGKYLSIGLDCFLSLTGIYFLICACIFYCILSYPREEVEKNNFILYFFVIPCAFLGVLWKRTMIMIR
jgi:hypothetical protein